MNIHEIFINPTNLQTKSCVAVIGGGGKTSFVFKVGYEISLIYNKVLLSSITKAGNGNITNVHFLQESTIPETLQKLSSQNLLYVLKKKINDEKYLGVTNDELKHLNHYSDITIFEADGARNLPLKAHNDRDPIIPSFATHVVILVGADVVNTRICDGFVHRPELFCSKWNLTKNTMLTPKLIAHVVTDKKGYMSKVKTNIPVVYFINKAGVFPQEAKVLSDAIVNLSNSAVYFGSIQSSWYKKVN